jgi:hypothetical protein
VSLDGYIRTTTNISPINGWPRVVSSKSVPYPQRHPNPVNANQVENNNFNLFGIVSAYNKMLR